MARSVRGINRMEASLVEVSYRSCMFICDCVFWACAQLWFYVSLWKNVSSCSDVLIKHSWICGVAISNLMPVIFLITFSAFGPEEARTGKQETRV